MFFSPSIQSQQLPFCAEVLNTWCPLPAGSEIQLLCQTMGGHMDLPLDASLGCKTMVWNCLVWQTENEQLHGVRRKLVLLGVECTLSPGQSPRLTGVLLPCRARASGVEKHTNGFKWTFQDSAGMKRVFEWILEVRGHSLRERDCVKRKTKEKLYGSQNALWSIRGRSIRKFTIHLVFCRHTPFFPSINFAGVKVGDFASVWQLSRSCSSDKGRWMSREFI